MPPRAPTPPKFVVASHVLILRHGQTDWNLEKRYQGVSDIPLNAAGIAQASAVAEVLGARGISAVVSSDLVRAAETARIIGAAAGVPVTFDSRLREVSSGPWEGKFFADIAREDPDLQRFWSGGVPGVRAGGTGETREEVAERMLASLESHFEAVTDGGTLVLVTHGGSSRSLTAAMLGLPPGTWNRFTNLGNCHWNAFRWVSGDVAEPHWQLTELDAGL